MSQHPDNGTNGNADALLTRDWLESMQDVMHLRGRQRVSHLLSDLQIHAQRQGCTLPVTSRTPYLNTIPAEKEAPYPGDLEIERRIKSLVRWNAMAMVVRANRQPGGVGGHISTFASAATLYEVGFNHFFRAKNDQRDGDLVLFQGHATPGMYSRAFLEGRLTHQHLLNFRRELEPGGGLSSYPHPWLMPDFWEVPTVSMGLGPIMAIYQARFMRYLVDRGLRDKLAGKVWAFLGDGETDEPESLGAISLAAREKLDNLIFVINCNLQRLDGPVRGNGKIIQELEAVFRGAGWNVVKCIWGRDWDPLFKNDPGGLLVQRAGEVVDGEYQKYNVEGGAYIRENFFGGDERLMAMVQHLDDEQLRKLRWGGHDPVKVHSAFKAAVEQEGAPTVVLAKTIKGYGLGEAGEGKNITHQQKKMNEEELLEFKRRFDIPISDDKVNDLPFYRPPEDSPEMLYLQERRRAMGGYLPRRNATCVSIPALPDDVYAEFNKGTGDKPASTTMVFVRLLSKLLRDRNIGKQIVPIIPDEARTFGMDPLFRQYGIYSHVGQLYTPVDAEQVMYYKEAKDGQILEEGITEAGAMSSFIASGTSYANHGVVTIPFFIYYSMFGFQRIGDLIWAAGDMRCRGFLVGGTAGRTTLAGEGLQHQDGQSPLLASAVPNLVSYDPAYAFELATIVKDGMRRMYEEREDVFYYLTVENENYPHPGMPEDLDPAEVERGVLKGLYRFRAATKPKAKLRATLFGSGAIMNEVVRAQELLAEKYNVHADVWSVTSYTELRREALTAERWNMLHPGAKPRVPYIVESLADAKGVLVAASDYMKTLPDSIATWMPRRLKSLGTDGYGRSETRDALRNFFEVDHRFVTLAVLSELAREGQLDAAIVQQAIQDLDIDTEKSDPMIS